MNGFTTSVMELNAETWIKPFRMGLWKKLDHIFVHSKSLAYCLFSVTTLNINIKQILGTIMCKICKVLFPSSLSVDNFVIIFYFDIYN